MAPQAADDEWRWSRRAVQAGALLGLVASASALGLAALGPILFLNANEPQSTAILTDDTGSLDSLVESPQQLLEAFGISNLNTHKCSSPPSSRVHALAVSCAILRAQKLPKIFLGQGSIPRHQQPMPSSPTRASGCQADRMIPGLLPWRVWWSQRCLPLLSLSYLARLRSTLRFWKGLRTIFGGFCRQPGIHIGVPGVHSPHGNAQRKDVLQGRRFIRSAPQQVYRPQYRGKSRGWRVAPMAGAGLNSR